MKHSKQEFIGWKFTKGVTFGFFLILSGLTSGCAVWPLSQAEHTTQPLPSEIKAYYDYPAPSLTHKVLKEVREHHYVHRQIEFSLSLPSDLQVKNLETLKREVERMEPKRARDESLRYTNRLDYYTPSNSKPGEQRPTILISPILGGNMVVDRFAFYYVGRGYNAVIVHRKRLYWESDKEMQQIEDYMRTSVLRLRQAIDWLETQPEVDSDRIGGFGISYGAILHTILAAVEPRIQHHILAMPAGPLSEVIVHCPENQIERLMKRVHEEKGWSHREIQAELEAVIKTDPMLLAPFIPKEKITYYVALFDRVVGAKRSWALWRTLGKPKLRVIPFGHYGGAVLFPYLQTQSFHILNKHML